MSHKLLRSQGKISGAEFRQLSRERRLYPGLYKIHERQYARRPVGFRTRGRGPSRVVFPVGVREDLRFVARGVSRGVKETRAALAERRLNKERFEEYLRQFELDGEGSLCQAGRSGADAWKVRIERARAIFREVFTLADEIIARNEELHSPRSA